MASDQDKKDRDDLTDLHELEDFEHSGVQENNLSPENNLGEEEVIDEGLEGPENLEDPSEEFFTEKTTSFNVQEETSTSLVAPEQGEPLEAPELETSASLLEEEVTPFEESKVLPREVFTVDPAFALKITEILEDEEKRDLEIFLREHHFIHEENEREMLRALNAGAILLSQLSEYSVAYLLKFLTRFSFTLEAAREEEILS